MNRSMTLTLLRPLDGTTWRALCYLTLGAPAAIMAIGLCAGAVTLGLLPSLLIIGAPVTLGYLAVLRIAAGAERRRAGIVLGAPISEPYRPVAGRLLTQFRGRLADPASWRDVLWFLTLLPVALPMAIVAWTLWAVGLALLLLPLWRVLVPGGEVAFNLGPGRTLLIGSTLSALPFSLLGLAGCWLAGWAVRPMAYFQARLARAALGPNRARGSR